MKKRKLRRWVIVSLDFLRVLMILCLLMQALWLSCFFADTLINGMVWLIAKFCQLVFGIMPIA